MRQVAVAQLVVGLPRVLRMHGVYPHGICLNFQRWVTLNGFKHYLKPALFKPQSQYGEASVEPVRTHIRFNQTV